MRPSSGGLANYIIWVVIIISFYVLVQTAASYNTTIAQGLVPQWLAIMQLVMMVAFLGSMIAILWQQQWGLWTLFAAVMARIPLGVALNHFDSLQNEAGHVITTGWIVRITIFLAIFWALILWAVLWAVRERVSADID